MAYRMEVYQNKAGGSGFDVSELAHNIQYTTSLDGSPGKLTCILEKDPAGILSVECGYTVKFYASDSTNDDKEELVFQGRIFTLGTDRTEAYKVTAYDLLRYLKNHDTWVIPSGEKSLHEVFDEICNKWDIPHGDAVKTMAAAMKKSTGAAFPLPQGVFNDTTLFDMLSWAMEMAGIGNYSIGGDETNFVRRTIAGGSEYNSAFDEDFQGFYFFVQDKAGCLWLNEIGVNSLVRFNGNYIVIGDESLLTDYQYELSIDKETYNEVLIVEEGTEETTSGGTTIKKKVPVDGARDSDSVERWGLLSRTVTIKTGATKGQIKEYLTLSLENGNKVSRTLKLNALGFPLYAGDTFVLRLRKLDVECKCYIISATHNYDADKHTMSLEVSTNPRIREVL